MIDDTGDGHWQVRQFPVCPVMDCSLLDRDDNGSHFLTRDPRDP